MLQGIAGNGREFALSRSRRQIGARRPLPRRNRSGRPLFHKREVILFASRNSCYQFPRIIGTIERGRLISRPGSTFRLPFARFPKDSPACERDRTSSKAIIDVAILLVGISTVRRRRVTSSFYFLAGAFAALASWVQRCLPPMF